MEWLGIARRMGGSIDDAAIAVRESYDIDKAQGVQLDTIGRIVVFSRDFIGQLTMQTAEFDALDGAECGDEEATFSEARVSDDAQMADGLYRLAIKAKIMKNTGDATIESIIQEMVFLVGPKFLRINDTENMEFSIEFAGDLTELQRWALFNSNLVQIPQGVLFGGFFELTKMVEFDDADSEFGDDEAMFSDFIGG
ncbi:PF11041 family protein [Bordetella bronchiseptica OSU095]|nr:PF11041 family protein [Bordetella bronchiseptica OSU095]